MQRIWHEGLEEEFRYDPDTDAFYDLFGEVANDEFQAGDQVSILDGHGGVEQSFTMQRPARELPAYEEFRETLAEQREAAEAQRGWIEDQQLRQEEADEDAADLAEEVEEIGTEFALEEVEDRKRFNVWAHRQRRETERITGHAFTEEEHADIRAGLLEALDDDPNANYGEIVQRRFPDGLPEQTTTEALAGAVEDAERREHGGLSREAAAAKIDRSGNPQDFSMVEVAEGRYEVVEHD